MNHTLKIAASVAVLAASSAMAGQISGKIKLNGEAPPAKEITPIKGDKFCGALHTKPVMTRTYVVGADKGLANVAVYINQVGCVYEPLVTAAMVGQTVDIKNSDPFMHNVNCQAKVNKGFNFAQTTQGQVNPRVFDKAELAVKLICNVHPWMAGYVHVFDHPFFAVSDKDGNFTISGDLPDGKYTVEANHIKAGVVSGEVEVKGGKATVNLELAVK